MGWTWLRARWTLGIRGRREDWDGSGVIVNKRKVDGGVSDFPSSAAFPSLSHSDGYYLAPHPTRWVLVVRDRLGVQHPVFVAPNVWHRHRVGSMISAHDRLRDVR
jgi:hypothetical protein